MTNEQIARAFANGDTTGYTNNQTLFIEGDTIYSYGHHFPIAKRYNGIYLFNSKSYSVTTSKHQSLVRCELGGDVVNCPDCDVTKAEEYLISSINELQSKQERARSEAVKADYRRKIESLKNQLNIISKL